MLPLILALALHWGCPPPAPATSAPRPLVRDLNRDERRERLHLSLRRRPY